MRVPKRAGEELHRMRAQTDYVFTKSKIAQFERDLERLIKVERPLAAAEVMRTKEMGDLSENAEYKEAKWKLRGINSRILLLEDRLRNAVVIDEDAFDGTVHVGSTVTIASDMGTQTFQLVGSVETNPARGRISHTSPIGIGLSGKKVGDTFEVNGRIYEILSVE